MSDPDERCCPACDESFIVIDTKDWRKYVKHLEKHIEDQPKIYT